MAELEELKAKYHPALDAMQQHGVQVTQVKMDGNKLFVQGYAPTDAVKNAVWDQIKAVDSSYSDLTCDIKVGAAPAGDLHGADPKSLASGLSAAFQSDQTPAFPSMLSHLFGQSDPQQKAGLLNQIMGAAGPSLLGAALPGPLAALLKGGGSVTPEQAQQVSPENLQSLAEHAQKANPSIIETASSFYSQHPQVVQALGAGALAMVMSHLKKS